MPDTNSASSLLFDDRGIALDAWHIPAPERRMPDPVVIENLRRKARSLRIQSCRAAPTLSRQLIELAEQYELRIAELIPPTA